MRNQKIRFKRAQLVLAKSTSRQSIYALFILALLLSLAACATTPPEPSPSPTAQENTPTPSVPTQQPTPIPSQTPTLEPTQPAVDSQHTLLVDELERNYWLHTPPGLDPNTPVPVVFAFHELGGVASMFKIKGLAELADQHGFLIVKPSGYGFGNAQSWNAGFCCGAAVNKNMDDIAFVQAILDDLQSRFKLDQQRIYATGHSNGAMFTYRLACEMSETFAAIAPIAGTPAIPYCQPSQPVSILHVHGLKDTSIPFEGKGSPQDQFYVPSISQYLAEFAKLYQCDPNPSVETLENGITHTVYAACKDESSVSLYTIAGLSHAQPEPYQFNAAEVMWDFFSAHPKQ